jgi:hypothetical protein
MSKKRKQGKLHLKKQTVAALEEKELKEVKGGLMISGGGGGTPPIGGFSITYCGPTSGHPLCTMQHNRRATKIR